MEEKDIIEYKRTMYDLEMGVTRLEVMQYYFTLPNDKASQKFSEDFRNFRTAFWKVKSSFLEMKLREVGQSN